MIRISYRLGRVGIEIDEHPTRGQATRGKARWGEGLNVVFQMVLPGGFGGIGGLRGKEGRVG